MYVTNTTLLDLMFCSPYSHIGTDKFVTNLIHASLYWYLPSLASP